MPVDRLQLKLADWLEERNDVGALKGAERIITQVVPARDGQGPRFLIAGFGAREFIRMNANDYLGLALHPMLREADEAAVQRYGTGPGAVRFISGTWGPHLALEQRLAHFHEREAAMIFSSAYATMMGVLPALVHKNTAILSDELNHNCIINAMRLTQPCHKFVYPHLDMAALEQSLNHASEHCSRAVIVTDGVFSMRGDHAPLEEIVALARRYDALFSENVIVVVDDSHGVGAYGKTGRGTEQVCGSESVDLLIATLGKAIGVNGGYLAASEMIVRYLREVSPFYIYSNPIGPAEATAAPAALDLIDSSEGRQRLTHLCAITQRFKQGLADLGYDTVPGQHPVIALLVHDTTRMQAMVTQLFEADIMATGLGYPVVPAGDEEIRFQLCADHTRSDIDHVLSALGRNSR